MMEGAQNRAAMLLADHNREAWHHPCIVQQLYEPYLFLDQAQQRAQRAEGDTAVSPALVEKRRGASTNSGDFWEAPRGPSGQASARVSGCGASTTCARVGAAPSPRAVWLERLPQIQCSVCWPPAADSVRRSVRRRRSPCGRPVRRQPQPRQGLWGAQRYEFDILEDTVCRHRQRECDRA